MFKMTINIATITVLFLMATGIVIARAEGLEAGSDRPACEVKNRDKRGTSSGPENDDGSQLAENKPNASRVSFQAEGTGLSRDRFRNLRPTVILDHKLRYFNEL